MVFSAPSSGCCRWGFNVGYLVQSPTGTRCEVKFSSIKDEKKKIRILITVGNILIRRLLLAFFAEAVVWKKMVME